MTSHSSMSPVRRLLPGANIDTDVIMPKQFLKGIDRSGLRDGVFTTCVSTGRVVSARISC